MWTLGQTFTCDLMTWRLLLPRSDVPGHDSGKTVDVLDELGRCSGWTGPLFSMNWAVARSPSVDPNSLPFKSAQDGHRRILSSAWAWQLCRRYWGSWTPVPHGDEMTGWYNLHGGQGVEDQRWLLPCGLSDWNDFCFDGLCFALIWPLRLTGRSLSTVN